jgi:hypothetical protein
MQRTFPNMRPDLVRILDNGGAVRILLPDPSNQPLMGMVAASRQFGGTTDDITAQVRHSIDNVKGLHGKNGRSPEVKVTSLLPRIGLNIIDEGLPNGFLMVQLYQTYPEREAGPIFFLTPSDGEWFAHFCDEFERLWGNGADC